jgi:hypothetical protein
MTESLPKCQYARAVASAWWVLSTWLSEVCPVEFVLGISQFLKKHHGNERRSPWMTRVLYDCVCQYLRVVGAVSTQNSMCV